MHDRVIKSEHKDLKWPFDGKPYIYCNVGRYGHSEYVDPWPGYSHDYDLVVAEFEHCERVVPLPWPGKLFILPFEGESRTNGHACGNEDHGYGKDDKDRRMDPYIVLMGKRIPIHPAMTRYLVAHEMGHILDATVQFKRGIKNDESDKEYAKMRGIEYNATYGSGGWILNTGEIIAQDIRIMLFEREVEFWPHPYPRPDEKVKAWWLEQIEKYLK